MHVNGISVCFLNYIHVLETKPKRYKIKNLLSKRDVFKKENQL